METFVMLVDSGDIDKVDEALECRHSGQARVYLLNLERFVGVRLVFNIKPLRLTPAGELFYKFAKKSLAEDATVLKKCREMEFKDSALANLRSGHKYAAREEVYWRCAEVFKDIDIRSQGNLRIRIATEPELIPLFRSNTLHLSLGYTEIPGVDREIIAQEIMVPVIAKDYDMQLSSNPIPLISILGLEKLIEELADHLLWRCGIETRPGLQVDNVIAAKWAVLGGAGISLIPDHLMVEDTISLVSEDFWAKIPIYAHRKHRARRNCLRKVGRA